MSVTPTVPVRIDGDPLLRYLPEAEIQGVDESGRFTLPDGRQARRVTFGKAATRPPENVHTPIVSDALGFPISSLERFEADRKANGFHGVEFLPDPQMPCFMQAHIRNPSEWQRYVEHRGMFDKNSSNGGAAILSEQSFERAKELTGRGRKRN